MKSYYLHFIRHGETAGNAEGRYIGRTDLPLTLESARQLRNYAEQGLYPDVDIVYTSPLTRCLQTANVIYPGQPLKVVENFIEYDFGVFENKTAAEVADNPDFKAWAAGKVSGVPEGETGEAFTARICEGLQQVVYDMAQQQYIHAGVILHGGIIMRLFAVCALPQRPMVEWRTEAGRGFTARITPSLFARSGVIEIIEDI